MAEGRRKVKKVEDRRRNAGQGQQSRPFAGGPGAWFPDRGLAFGTGCAYKAAIPILIKE